MNTYAWTVLGLAAFDAVIIGAFFCVLRFQPSLDRAARIAIALGLSGFVFHAFLFFSGPILYLQLATLAALYFVLFVPLKRDRSNAPSSSR